MTTPLAHSSAETMMGDHATMPSRAAPTCSTFPRSCRKSSSTAVEFMFPHYFLLPMFAAMSSYRIRPLTPETCLFEIWSLVIRPEGEELRHADRSRRSCPTIRRTSRKFRGRTIRTCRSSSSACTKAFEEMRLSREWEGLISNYQRLIDGYLAGLDDALLDKGQQRVNHGYDKPIIDIGF